MWTKLCALSKNDSLNARFLHNWWCTEKRNVPDKGRQSVHGGRRKAATAAAVPRCRSKAVSFSARIWHAKQYHRKKQNKKQQIAASAFANMRHSKSRARLERNEDEKLVSRANWFVWFYSFEWKWLTNPFNAIGQSAMSNISEARVKARLWAVAWYRVLGRVWPKITFFKFEHLENTFPEHFIDGWSTDVATNRTLTLTHFVNHVPITV